jgi:FlaA1/EpsC-like NDP-sugar epimerase
MLCCLIDFLEDNLSQNPTQTGLIQRPAVRRFVLDMLWVVGGGAIGVALTGQNPIFWRLNLVAVALIAFCAAMVQRYFEIYRIRRFPHARKEWQVFGFHFIGVLGIALILGFAFRMAMPVAFAVLTGLLGTLGMLIERFVHYQSVGTAATVVTEKKRRALIIGAGSATEMLLRDLAGSNRGMDVVGLLDDDPHKIGSDVLGVRVLGSIDDLKSIAEAHRVNEIILAIPSLDREGQRRILGICQGVSARLRMMPSISRQLAESGYGLPVLRDIAPEELLQRDSIETDMSAAIDYIADEVILITGGGGSIGSELARQIASLRPKLIVLLGKGENSIFEAEQELRERGFKNVVPVIAGVRDRLALDRVMQEYRPSVVFHAAAHKHVPLMERVPIEAARNNVHGTLTLAQSAIDHGVKKFILISTDKAVNPTNVMGASKRAAEMVILALAGRSETQFAAVRFGNVLGSRGSLIPILKRQISKGGPITITDERMTRFFMTIPEAAQLVIQAGSHGGAGEIFILDMGAPVKIVDVARGLLDLYGLEEGIDIDIVFIGARPGEKIHEELSWESEDLERLDGGKILRLKSPQRVTWEILEGRLEEIWRLCDLQDEDGVRAELMNLVDGQVADTAVVIPVEQS